MPYTLYQTVSVWEGGSRFGGFMKPASGGICKPHGFCNRTSQSNQGGFILVGFCNPREFSPGVSFLGVP